MCIGTNLDGSLIRIRTVHGERGDDDHYLDVVISLTSYEPLNSDAAGEVLDNTSPRHNGTNTTISTSTVKIDDDATATGKLEAFFSEQGREDAVTMRTDAVNTAEVPVKGTEEVAVGVMGGMPRTSNHLLPKEAFYDFLTGSVHAQGTVSVLSCEFLKALLRRPGELDVPGGTTRANHSKHSSKGLLMGDTDN